MADPDFAPDEPRTPQRSAAVTPTVTAVRGNVITGMWAGTLLHETGHAMFDMLDKADKRHFYLDVFLHGFPEVILTPR